MGTLLNQLKKEIMYAANPTLNPSLVVESEVESLPLDLVLQQDGTLPQGALAHTYSRRLGSTNAAGLVTLRTTAAPIPLLGGQTVRTISFLSATTLAGVPTFQKFGLYNSAFKLVAQTNDDGATAWAANAVKTLTLTTPYVVPASDVYYVAILVAATTVPTIVGLIAPAGAVTLFGSTLAADYRLTGVTTAVNLTDLQATLALSGVASVLPYAYVS